MVDESKRQRQYNRALRIQRAVKNVLSGGYSVGGGALLGAHVGTALVGRKFGRIPGIVTGAVGGLKAHQALKPTVQKLRYRGHEDTADIVGMTPLVGSLAGTLGTAALYSKPTMDKVHSAGRGFREVMKGMRGKLTPRGKVSVVKHIPVTAKPIRKLLMSSQLPTLDFDEIGEPIRFAIGKLDPANKGKFTKTEAKTGKSREELAHSKNPLTRKRAQFALNASKWHHGGKKKEMSARDLLDSIINLKAIDLGRDRECYPGDIGSSKPGERSFPSLYVSDRDKDIDLPLEGMARVKYKLRSKEMRQDHEGKKRHSASIEIHSIDPIKEEQKKSGVKTLNISPTEPMRRFSRKEELDSIINFGFKEKMGEIGGFLKARHAIGAVGAKTAAMESGIRSATKVAPGVAAKGAASGMGGYVKGFVTGKAAEKPDILNSIKSGASDLFRGGRNHILTNSGNYRDVGIGGGALLAGAGLYRRDKRGAHKMSARDRLSDIIHLGDPRPRNPLGEFSGEEEGPNPTSVAMVYKQPQMGNAARDIAIGGAGGLAAEGAKTGLKALAGKLKKIRK